MFKNELLRNEIESRGLSLAEVDRRIGAGNSGMTSKYVNGLRYPNVDMLYKFLLGIGYTEDDLKSQLLIDWYEIPASTLATPGEKAR